MQQLSSKTRLSISNFTFDKGTCTISFYSPKTNKCWSRGFSRLAFSIWENRFSDNRLYKSQRKFNSLKKLCKNGNN